MLHGNNVLYNHRFIHSMRYTVINTSYKQVISGIFLEISGGDQNFLKLRGILRLYILFLFFVNLCDLKMIDHSPSEGGQIAPLQKKSHIIIHRVSDVEIHNILHSVCECQLPPLSVPQLYQCDHRWQPSSQLTLHPT